MPTKPSKLEREGVKMIQDLQLMAGIKEPADRALRNWRNMSESERQQTRKVHRMFCSRT